MLILFDIDGTLVRRTGPHHRQALEEAVYRVTGSRVTTDGIPVHGMLDQDIIAQMMRHEGMSQARIRETMPAIQTKAENIYVRICPDLRKKTCPGARSLLYRLQRRKIVLALVTGNLTRIGWKKLECAGLKDYFLFGAFAEMAKTRAGLAKLAIRTARQRGLPAKNVTLIGDAPSDILAAKANGIRSISVATGISKREELLEHNPDLLLEDMRGFSWEMLGTYSD